MPAAGQALFQAEAGLSSEPAFSVTFRLVPIEYWDDPEGPLGHELQGGRIFLFRAGSFEPEIVAPAGEPIELPPGDWTWMAEVPGFVSTSTDDIYTPSSPEAPRQRLLIVPVVPACHVTRSEDDRWRHLDRVDVVSVTESAVYPQVRGGRSDFWIPAGAYLAYGVRGGELVGISSLARCAAEDEVTLGVPEAPAADVESLLVTAELPEMDEELDSEEILAQLSAGGQEAARPTLPTATVWQGRRGAYFFLDVPAGGAPRALSLEHPDLRTARKVVESVGGSAREISLGALRPRRDVEVTVDYRPKRAHDSAEISIAPCGRDRAEVQAAALVERCREPLETKPLEPGVASYRFESLDDGQYLLDARIDDEEVPGLGQEVLPYLDPDSDAEPPPRGVIDLEEYEVYGHLLVDGEPVAGEVRLSPWPGVSGIPSKAAVTDEDLVYHLDYFGRYPMPGLLAHFPDEIRDGGAEDAPEGLFTEDPSDYPGLYCCFRMLACTSAGVCRTFNEHSVFTGGGEFDIEMPEGARIDLRVVDAGDGRSVQGAEVLLDASLAFHFYFGDVVWHQALGVEPNVFEVGADGRAAWFPTRSGLQRMVVTAPGYTSESRKIEVPAAGMVELTVELRPDQTTRGTRLIFDEEEAVVATKLVAFDRGGVRRPACDAWVNTEGYVEVKAGCERELTYLLVDPLAAIQTFAAEQIAGSGVVRARRWPRFPPTVRLVDADGSPISRASIQLRLGDLTITPDDLYASGGGLPFRPTTNAAGEVVLQGVDVDTVEEVEVSPWRPFEEHWVTLHSGERGVVEVVATPAG